MSENDTYELARWVYYKMKIHQSITLESIPGQDVWELLERFDEEDNCSNGYRKRVPHFGECIGDTKAQKCWRIKTTNNGNLTIWRLQ